MNKHYWVSGYSLSHDLSGWARNNRGTCEWVDINKNETKNSICGKSPVCKQPDTPLMFIRLELSWYPDRYGQSPGGDIFWLMFTLTAYLLSQVSLLPAVTVLHLHVLYPWVHIHLGHAGIKEKPQFLISHYLQANYAITPSSIVHSVNIYLIPQIRSIWEWT